MSMCNPSSVTSCPVCFQDLVSDDLPPFVFELVFELHDKPRHRSTLGIKSKPSAGFGINSSCKLPIVAPRFVDYLDPWQDVSGLQDSRYVSLHVEKGRSCVATARRPAESQSLVTATNQQANVYLRSSEYRRYALTARARRSYRLRIHVHLPKLVECGLVAYDLEEGTVAPLKSADAVTPYLELAAEDDIRSRCRP